jgi:Xaa-Pro dipeptidase
MPTKTIRSRVDALRSFMSTEGISASLITDPDDQFYLSGFRALLYSRPILLFVREDRTSIVVPGLEEAHARHDEAADEILAYYEHPEMASRGSSYLEHLDGLLTSCPEGARIGVEMGSCPTALANHIESRGFSVADVGRRLTQLRYVKDEGEVALMTEAGRLVNAAVRESLAACGAGVTEIEVDAAGNAVLFEETAREHPDATLELLVMSPSGPVRSVMPHVFSNTRRIEPGDVLIHSRQVSLNGYRAELERTVIVGEPSAEQERAFEAAREAQAAALDLIRPGVLASEVDDAARRVVRETGLGEYAVHRTGHGLGISAHEEPYLRFDNDLVLEEGMVFTVEPGIYVPGLGGFRHSDTVVLTQEGSEPITDHPRGLEDLVR